MDNILQRIRDYTGHEYALLTKRANASILLAMRTAKDMSEEKKSMIIPDQGGWLTFRQTPKKIGLLSDEVKTDYGLIDLEDLRRYLGLGNAAGFIYTNPAGYYAAQPMQEIYSLCKGICTVILDASGSIGNKEQCDGDYADLIVGSFGKWKPVNAGKGGFISFKNKKLFEVAMTHYVNPEFSEKEIQEIDNKLEEGPKRIQNMTNLARKVKNDLKDLTILHPDLDGLNVIVAFKNEEEKQKIIAYCEKESFEYTDCPKYIRVNENAISIEIKRK